MNRNNFNLIGIFHHFCFCRIKGPIFASHFKAADRTDRVIKTAHCSRSIIRDTRKHHDCFCTYKLHCINDRCIRKQPINMINMPKRQ